MQSLPGISLSCCSLSIWHHLTFSFILAGKHKVKQSPIQGNPETKQWYNKFSCLLSLKLQGVHVWVPFSSASSSHLIPVRSLTLLEKSFSCVTLRFGSSYMTCYMYSIKMLNPIGYHSFPSFLVPFHEIIMLEKARQGLLYNKINYNDNQLLQKSESNGSLDPMQGLVNDIALARLLLLFSRVQV